MENFIIKKIGKNLHIEGFPDAIKIIKLANAQSKRLADIFLHKTDLEFAWECLEEINNISPDNVTLKQSLWRSAIVHFGKCFGVSASRFQLNQNSIWKGNELALTAFEYFKNLRNKHIVHDENSYSQSVPGAVLNNGKKEYKIEKIICVSLIGETLEKDNYNNLHLLIQTAKKWVTDEFDTLCNNLTIELENTEYNDLIEREEVKYEPPKIEDISEKRKTP